MASPQNQTKDSILPISNTDFFRHKHCPTRTVNTRCRCLSTCERVHFGDQAAPEKAIQLRDQIMQQVKSSRNELPTPESHIWDDIETKVVMLMEWVLCKKHMYTLQCSSEYDYALDEARVWHLRQEAEAAALDRTCHCQQQRGSISIDLGCSFLVVCFCGFSPGNSATVTWHTRSRDIIPALLCFPAAQQWSCFRSFIQDATAISVRSSHEHSGQD